MANRLLEAAILRACAKRHSALATLERYLQNSVAIGEHPQLNDEIDKLLDEAGEAHERMETLTYFNDEGEYTASFDDVDITTRTKRT